MISINANLNELNLQLIHPLLKGHGVVVLTKNEKVISMNKEIIKDILSILTHYNRKLAVGTIKRYASDEYETLDDVYEFAEKTDEQLKVVLKDLIDYYLDNEE